jgi:hypothetical protein
MTFFKCLEVDYESAKSEVSSCHSSFNKTYQLSVEINRVATAEEKKALDNEKFGSIVCKALAKLIESSNASNNFKDKKSGEGATTLTNAFKNFQCHDEVPAVPIKTFWKFNFGYHSGSIFRNILSFSVII